MARLALDYIYASVPYTVFWTTCRKQTWLKQYLAWRVSEAGCQAAVPGDVSYPEFRMAPNDLAQLAKDCLHVAAHRNVKTLYSSLSEAMASKFRRVRTYRTGVPVLIEDALKARLEFVLKYRTWCRSYAPSTQLLNNDDDNGLFRSFSVLMICALLTLTFMWHWLF